MPRHWSSRGDAAAHVAQPRIITTTSPMLAMQSQPLVDESPQHHHHHHHRKIPHHHSGLPSLNRFRLAVRNVAHSLHLNHHHHHQRAGAGSPDPSVAPHPTRHKFHGASSLLGRFRSAKLNMSDDSDQATPLTTTKPLAAEAAKTDQKEDLGDPCRQDTWTPPEVCSRRSTATKKRIERDEGKEKRADLVKLTRQHH